jgi:CheY-like chemotaxis protein
MAKFLIIEDGPEQRRHAQNQIQGHSLTFATTAEEVPKMEQFDFVLTDLFLPKSEGEEPDPEVGECLFREALQVLEDDNVDGVALVSNYEHHMDDSSMRKFLSDYYESAYTLQDLGFERWQSYLAGLASALSEESEEDKRKDKVIIVFDANIQGYSHFINSSGEIVLKDEVPDAPSEDTAADEVAVIDIEHACKELGWEPAKPWGDVVEALNSLQ